MVPHAEQNEIKTMADGGSPLPQVLKNPRMKTRSCENNFEYLIGHTTDAGLCGCSECQRYVRVRALLLEIFSEPAPQQKAAVTTMPMAA